MTSRNEDAERLRMLIAQADIRKLRSQWRPKGGTEKDPAKVRAGRDGALRRWGVPLGERITDALDEALAAERRATVERAKSAFVNAPTYHSDLGGACVPLRVVNDLLDEVAK